MLFDDEDTALLKKWIVKRLEDMWVAPELSARKEQVLIEELQLRCRL